jgi:2'-hydroxyisoflavone reductase
VRRRSFIQHSMAAIVGAACTRLALAQTNANTSPKRILVLGGTHFLGPAIVEAAIAQGHVVTLFNRGVTNPDLFPHVEHLRGFRSCNPRDQDFSALAHRQFDAAVDVWPSDPTVVASAAQFLKERVKHYLYVSSIAAYDSKEFERGGIEENAPLEPWNSPARPYNRGKAESERTLHSIREEQITIVRPGPIKGTRDTTPDLLTWLIRAQNGGTHIGPGNGEDPVELVDVKDVARFLLLAISRTLYGTFNLTGRPMAFRQFLDACNAATRSDTRFEWIPLMFLREHNLDTDAALKTFAGNFPLWRPAGDQPGLFQINSDKAYGVGWQPRAFQETALDCLSYFALSVKIWRGTTICPMRRSGKFWTLGHIARSEWDRTRLSKPSGGYGAT